MTTEGIRAAVAAFANANDAVYDEERAKLVMVLGGNKDKPYVFMAIPAMFNATAYSDFITNELKGSGLSVALIDEEVVVIARNAEMCNKGAADYRNRKFKYTMDKFFNSH